MILFVTGTGTGVGKTVVTRSLTAHLKASSFPVVSLKPLETGCDPDALDAIALATACGKPELARDPRFYRVAPPLAPYAATLSGSPPPDFDGLVRTCRALAEGSSLCLVEAAGGLLVPLDANRTMAEFALALGSRLVLVAPDRLGVLSDTLAIVEAATRRDLPIAAVVLNRGAHPPDPSQQHNAQILAERTRLPVTVFEPAGLDDASLIAAVQESGLLDHLGLQR